LDVARRLWTERTVSHHGEFFDFPEVAFEPKPQRIPVIAGGESPAALRRAARCDGWISMPQTLDGVGPQLDRLRALRDTDDPAFEITVHAYELSGPDEIAEWEKLGVDRLIVRPWTRTREALPRLAEFAAAYGLGG